MKYNNVTRLLTALSIISILSLTTTLIVYGQTTINGAGATFPFPLIDLWRTEYQKVSPETSINYQSIGSGGGVKQFIEKTVDFGATDAPLTAEEQRSVGASVVHIPETIGSVVAAYNLPTVEDKRLNLTGNVLAQIFLGTVTKWSDPAIVELNPGITLPDEDIVVVHRSDGSGTTFVWTSYLSNSNSEWNSTIGQAKSIEWPTGIGAPGNEAVSSTISSTPNSIGYIELTYALATDAQTANIQNPSGNFIEPSLESTAAAVEAAATSLPRGDQSWTDVSILNAPGEESYPIASFSYILLFKDLATNPSIDQNKAKALVDFLSWAITEGQSFASGLEYVPLPDSVVKANQATLQSLTFNGDPLS